MEESYNCVFSFKQWFDEEVMCNVEMDELLDWCMCEFEKLKEKLVGIVWFVIVEVVVLLFELEQIVMGNQDELEFFLIEVGVDVVVLCEFEFVVMDQVKFVEIICNDVCDVVDMFVGFVDFLCDGELCEEIVFIVVCMVVLIVMCEGEDFLLMGVLEVVNFDFGCGCISFVVCVVWVLVGKEV